MHSYVSVNDGDLSKLETMLAASAFFCPQAAVAPQCYSTFVITFVSLEKYSVLEVACLGRGQWLTWDWSDEVYNLPGVRVALGEVTLKAERHWSRSRSTEPFEQWHSLAHYCITLTRPQAHTTSYERLLNACVSFSTAGCPLQLYYFVILNYSAVVWIWWKIKNLK